MPEEYQGFRYSVDKIFEAYHGGVEQAGSALLKLHAHTLGIYGGGVK